MAKSKKASKKACKKLANDGPQISKAVKAAMTNMVSHCTDNDDYFEFDSLIMFLMEKRAGAEKYQRRPLQQPHLAITNAYLAIYDVPLLAAAHTIVAAQAADEALLNFDIVKENLKRAEAANKRQEEKALKSKRRKRQEVSNEADSILTQDTARDDIATSEQANHSDDGIKTGKHNRDRNYKDNLMISHNEPRAKSNTRLGAAESPNWSNTNVCQGFTSQRKMPTEGLRTKAGKEKQKKHPKSTRSHEKISVSNQAMESNSVKLDKRPALFWDPPLSRKKAKYALDIPDYQEQAAHTSEEDEHRP